MVRGARFLLCSLGGFLAAAMGLATAAAAAPDRIVLRMDFFGFAGMRVLTLHSEIEENPGRYAITADYATSGIAGLLMTLSTHSQAHGRLAAATTQPESFRADSLRNGAERHDHVDYRPDGTVDGGSIPPLPEVVTAVAAHGTVDELTAYFILERQVARTGSCVLSVPVYDGRRRYDFYFTDAGQQTLSPSNGQRFSGNTTACRMTRQMRMHGTTPEIVEGARTGMIWYARLLPGDVVVPVRMELETQIGTVGGYLAEIHGRGVDLNLIP